MSDRENLDRLMAQWLECPLEVSAAALDQNLAAWKQAMTEFGVPDHVNGKCPALPCPCGAMEKQVTRRAYELLGLPASATEEDWTS